MTQATNSLSGRIAVVTGGSRGLGLAIARLLGSHGAGVVIGARTEAAVAAAVTELRSEGIEAWGRPCDVGNVADVQGLRDEALAHGTLDIWINNAGASGAFGPTATTPADGFERVVRTNILGTFHGSRTALGTFLAQGHGDLVNLLGRGDNRPVPLQTAYGSSKAWVRHFTAALRLETAKTGVRVHGFNPGLVVTDMLGQVTVQPGYEKKVRALPVIVGLWGQSPEVAARPVLDLVTSDAAEYRDLSPRTMLTRGVRHALTGRLRRSARMPLRVTVVSE